MGKPKIAIIGLGYVGLPLAIEFGKIFETIGFDINKSRIKELLAGKDSTLEVTSNSYESKMLSYTIDLRYSKLQYLYYHVLLQLMNLKNLI